MSSTWVKKGLRNEGQHLVFRFTGVHQALGPKDGQVLRDVGRFDLNMLQNASYRQFPPAKRLNDVNPGGVGQHLKHLRLELPQRLESRCFNDGLRFTMLEYSNMRNLQDKKSAAVPPPFVLQSNPLPVERLTEIVNN